MVAVDIMYTIESKRACLQPVLAPRHVMFMSKHGVEGSVRRDESVDD